MDRYFSKFPAIYYRNKECHDISRRIRIANADRNNPYNFYPFLLQDELRSDQVAEFYYNDPEMDWFVYHTNRVLDPYYDWYNSNEVFEAKLIAKYGSLENAMKKVYRYHNNWATDETQLTPSQYEDMIPVNWKKYYMPVWGPKAEILSYKRKEYDFYQNTNRILKYTISYVTGNSFTIGETIDLKYAGQIVGTAEVEYSNSSTVSIKSVFGNTVANTSVVINLLGETSGSNATANAVTTVYESIPLDEEVFWSPIYYYDWEVMQNEDKKHIQLINNELAPIISQDFEEKLNK
jgi:hypothetical protein